MGIHDPVSLNDYLSKSPDLVKLELRDGSLLGSHPAFVRQMAEVGRMANEGQLKFGVSGTEMASDMKAQYDQLSRDIHAAYQSGDRGRTATLSAQRSVIAERLHGTQAIVVAGRSILTALRQPLASHLEPSFLEDGLEKGPRCRISRLWYRHLTLNHQPGAYDYRRCQYEVWSKPYE